jgi:hypothetical protein
MVVADSLYLHGICLEGRRKNTKDFVQDQNLVPPEYKPSPQNQPVLSQIPFIYVSVGYRNMNVMLDVSIIWGVTSVYTAFQKLNPMPSAGEVGRGSYSVGAVTRHKSLSLVETVCVSNTYVRQWTLSNIVFSNEGTIVTIL